MAQGDVRGFGLPFQEDSCVRWRGSRPMVSTLPVPEPRKNRPHRPARPLQGNGTCRGHLELLPADLVPLDAAHRQQAIAALAVLLADDEPTMTKEGRP